MNVGYSERGFGTKPIAIDVKLPKRAEWIGERFLSTPLAAGGTARQGENVELGDGGTVKREPASYILFRCDGRLAETVQAEVAGRFEAPVYGMLAVQDQIKKMDRGNGGPPDIHYHGQPLDSRTIASFGRRMGSDLCHFSRHERCPRRPNSRDTVGRRPIRLVCLPLAILFRVPLTLIEIVLGHWLIGGSFHGHVHQADLLTAAARR